MINKGLFTSARGDWKTPKALFQALDAEFNFDFDPCPVNPKEDGLEIEWGKCNYVNPPYGRKIGDWIKKGYEEALKGKIVVMLLPARPDTRYWHKYILPFNCSLPRDKKIIWVAGLVDGEGCIFIKRDKPTRNSKHKSEIFTLGLKVTMTHKKTIYRLKEIFKRGHITIPKKLEGTKQPYSWTVRSNQAAYVLNLIYPFLITKKQEAFKALEFSTLESDRRGQKRVPEDSLSVKREYYWKLRELKDPNIEIPIITTEIRFIKGRLKFDDQENPAPFPSAIVIFKK